MSQDPNQMPSHDPNATGSTPSPPPPPPPPTTGASGPGAADPADVEKNKVFALLAYIGILWLVPLLAAKDSPFAKYHANQGLALFIAGFGAMIVLTVLSVIGAFIPVVGCVCMFLPMLGGLAWMGYAIMGIINAVNGQMKPLPGFPAITLIK